MRPLLIIVFVFLFLLKHECVYGDANKFILVYKKQSMYGLEQISLTLKDDELRLTSNTNLWKEKFPYYYGIFSRKVSVQDKSEIKNLLKNWGAVNRNKKEPVSSIHSAKLLLNGKEISLNHKIHTNTIEFLKNNFEHKNWQKEKGVVLKDAKDFLPIKCNKNEKNLCIFEFGFIHL